jgi:transmembrane sensor
MIDCDREPPSKELLQIEARAWLKRMTSGEATEADVEALSAWRGTSAAHARAFAEAALLWDVMGDATAAAIRRNPAVLPAAASSTVRHRRAFIAGGAALAASLGALALLRPPLGLWPSLSELHADYRTRTGEQRRIEVADAVSVEMNTQTSIDLHPAVNGAVAIELISGEAEIAKRTDPSRDFLVLAGSGSAEATLAAFNIRKDGSSVSVTCVDGAVRVRHRGGAVVLLTRQQISYDEARLGQIVSTDPAVVTAWRQGLLIFRGVPLARVIEEVNRYRPGKIILLDATLGRKRVVADFRLDHLGDVVDFISEVMNVPVRSLPGGVVLLG